MAIPPLQSNGELPPGEHSASLDEIEVRFGQGNDQRKKLMRGLRDASDNFCQAGVRTIWVNGSFVTSKKKPNDIDGCWEYTNAVDTSILDDVFLSHTRQDAKIKYGLDFFISNVIEAGSGLPFPRFFQVNRDGEPKGIIVVHFGGST